MGCWPVFVLAWMSIVVLATPTPTSTPVPKVKWVPNGHFTKNEIYWINHIHETFMDISPVDSPELVQNIAAENAKRNFLVYCPGDSLLVAIKTEYEQYIKYMTTAYDKNLNLSDRHFVTMGCAFFQDETGKRVRKNSCDQVEPKLDKPELRSAYSSCLRNAGYDQQECILPYFEEKESSWICSPKGFMSGLMSRKQAFNYQLNTKYHECCSAAGAPLDKTSCAGDLSASLNQCKNKAESKRSYKHLCCALGSEDGKKILAPTADCVTEGFAANKGFDFQCPKDKAMVAIETTENKAVNDRSFKITCCGVALTDPPKSGK